MLHYPSEKEASGQLLDLEIATDGDATGDDSEKNAECRRTEEKQEKEIVIKTEEISLGNSAFGEW